jgi:hypothetical protein
MFNIFKKSPDKQETEHTNEAYNVRDIMIGHDDSPFVIVVYFDGENIKFISSASRSPDYISVFRTHNEPKLIHRRDKEQSSIDRYYYDLFVPDNFKLNGANTTVNDIDAFGTLEKRQVNVM